MFIIWLMFCCLVVWIIFSFANAIIRLAAKQYKPGEKYGEKYVMVISVIVGVFNLIWAAIIIFNPNGWRGPLVNLYLAVVISLLMTIDDVPKNPLGLQPRPSPKPE